MQLTLLQTRRGSLITTSQRNHISFLLIMNRRRLIRFRHRRSRRETPNHPTSDQRNNHQQTSFPTKTPQDTHGHNPSFQDKNKTSCAPIHPIAAKKPQIKRTISYTTRTQNILVAVTPDLNNHSTMLIPNSHTLIQKSAHPRRIQPGASNPGVKLLSSSGSQPMH